MTFERRDFIKATGTGLGLTALGSTATTTIAADTGGTTESFRAYWADAFNDGIKTEEQIDALVERSVEQNLNAIIAQVVRRGDFYGDEGHPPRTEDPEVDDDIDPLALLIEKASEHGLEVHAWLVVGKMADPEDLPESEDHPVNAHGPDSEDPWVSQTPDGDVIELGGDYAFDLGHPGVHEFFVETVESIVENYDVDGINLDYIRYPDVEDHQEFGYNETAVQRFLEATEYDDVPEPPEEVQFPPMDPGVVGQDYIDWTAWRRRQVTDLVRRIYLTVKDHDPSLRVSIDGIAWGPAPIAGPNAEASWLDADDAWQRKGNWFQIMQDWRGWMYEGIIDTNIVMNYAREFVDNQRDQYRGWADYLKDLQNATERDAVIGQANFFNFLEDTDAQIRVAQEPSEHRYANDPSWIHTEEDSTANGWAGFSYANPKRSYLHRDGEDPELDEEYPDMTLAEAHDTITEMFTEDPPEQAGEDAEPVFADETAIPEMPWVHEEGHISVTVTEGGQPLDQAEVTLSGEGETIERTTDGSGWVGFAALDPGEYTVESGDESTTITVEAGSVTPAALDTGVDFERFDVCFQGCGQARIVVSEDDVATADDEAPTAHVIVESDGEAVCETVAITEENTTTIPGQFGDAPVVTYTADGKILGVAASLSSGEVVVENENNCATTPNTPDVLEADCLPEGAAVDPDGPGCDGGRGNGNGN
ncbi:family 10 glycosylhydrolase [Natronobacterium texcoconense]|uniref:Uncharacterized lipoprotein YddW, UPF0748 family n=1 Tax=Natronobacterium texcoconense TaxID=1095778 RepID=A0A1H1FV10_NATTX|nr:family 10 glycosylhydrolase [Natronobacterium texcoconense]SDR04832.1 Uncharacterized lipoprotein YddW, UPF0748 family [Natronobacterium texcoconense]